MTRPQRTTWGQALKLAATKFAREAERFVGARDETPCGNCSHPRMDHCGCGQHCGMSTDSDVQGCGCPGFTPKVDG